MRIEKRTADSNNLMRIDIIYFFRSLSKDYGVVVIQKSNIDF